MKQIVECIPNFSEGRDMSVIDKITAEIKKVSGVTLLDVDPGYDTNRTVVTFVGEPEPVKEAAFMAVKKSHELIDMRKQSGSHPRFGACDVCPLVPVSNISMDECVKHARELGKKLGEELEFPVYFYEFAATSEKRRNLAVVRKGEYEALESRVTTEEWKPDAGPAAFNATTGATAVGARKFLVAYNVNLNTKNHKKANYIAFRIREKGYLKRDENFKVVKDENGKKVMLPGLFEGVKAIGWYVDDYKRAQISINITDIDKSPVHEVFEACREIASKRGLRVTGSEIVGVVPEKAIADAGLYYLKKQKQCRGVSKKELVDTAVQSMGLDDVAPFNPEKKIIENTIAKKGLADLTISDFNDLLASDAPAPGGGSVAALCGSLAAALGAMVPNLTYNKKGYKKHNESMDSAARKMQLEKETLLSCIDEDTEAFNKMMDAGRKKKKAEKSGDEQALKKASEAVRAADEYAVNVPLKVLRASYGLIETLEDVCEKGNINAISDVGVAVLLVRTAVRGAALNVQINLTGFDKEDSFRKDVTEEVDKYLAKVDEETDAVLKTVTEKIG